ncbi:glycosyltransferase family 2 protein [Frankia sp. AgB1.9]|nr:glycosyltransferase family 2 protein [Frankia sp. AgW1.1]MBL7552543.1 glycosyltransferase family 2 protein [Frankia sp. AgB1.9]MBL7624750.1 glycosyltransferase family 2 protein [Frankia sp. AgB1.8]
MAFDETKPGDTSGAAGNVYKSASTSTSRLPSSAETVTASVVICAYTLRRWDDLTAAVVSVRAQSVTASDIIVVIDHNEELLERALSSFSDAIVVPNAGKPGLSGARNTGVERATGDVVFFLDDDARAQPDWLEHMLAHYADPAVQGVGGAALPRWPEQGAHSGRPAWFPPEFDWVIGCSYIGLPTSVGPVRNPIGAGMSIRRSAFATVGGFSDGLGRVGSIPLGCEETEFGIRLRRDVAGAVILYEPAAVVLHGVTPDRITWQYYRRRCFSEGISKAVVARRVGQESALEAEKAYVRHVLPRAVRRDLRHPRTWARAAMVLVGVTFTVAGYGRGAIARATS